MVSELHSESSGARSTLSGKIVFLLLLLSKTLNSHSTSLVLAHFQAEDSPAMDRHPIQEEVGHGHQETPRYGPDNMG